MVSLSSAVRNQHLGAGTPCDPNRADGQKMGGRKATSGNGEGFDLGFLISFRAPLVSAGAPRSAGVHRSTAAPRFPGGIGGSGGRMEAASPGAAQHLGGLGAAGARCCPPGGHRRLPGTAPALRRVTNSLAVHTPR